VYIRSTTPVVTRLLNIRSQNYNNRQRRRLQQRTVAYYNNTADSKYETICCRLTTTEINNAEGLPVFAATAITAAVLALSTFD
jgi:hypothetical protein